MEMLQIIIVVSIVMWYIIDRFKPLWEDWQYGKYVTIAVSAVFAFALAFGIGGREFASRMLKRAEDGVSKENHKP